LIAGRPIFSQIPFILFMVIHAYGIWVVNRYVEQLRSENRDIENSEMYQANRRKDSEYERDGIERLQKNRETLYKNNPAFQKDENEKPTGHL
jgi:hypothetical protein